MIEADVIIGKLNNQANGTDMVIMGHPPNTTSDLSLEEFLKKVTSDTKKGIKLDFKSIEAFETGLLLIQKSGNVSRKSIYFLNLALYNLKLFYFSRT
jgi:hypothetical protein